jgi:hypothetical protein
MFKWFPAAVVLAVASLIALGSCSTAAGTDGVTVSGTLRGSYIGFVVDPVITIDRSGSSFSIEVTTSGPSSDVTGPFSIANVPPGDYSITVEFTATTPFSGSEDPYYTIDGGPQIEITGMVPTGSDPWGYILTFPDISISTDAIIDVYVGDYE